MVDEEVLSDLQKIWLKILTVKIKCQHHVNALGNQLTVLHFILVTVKLNKLDNTIDKTFLDGVAHLVFHGLETDLPESCALTAEQVSSLKNQEHIAESLHPHTERHPELLKEVEIVDNLLELTGFVSHLNEACIDDLFDFIFDPVA